MGMVWNSRRRTKTVLKLDFDDWIDFELLLLLSTWYWHWNKHIHVDDVERTWNILLDKSKEIRFRSKVKIILKKRAKIKWTLQKKNRRKRGNRESNEEEKKTFGRISKLTTWRVVCPYFLLYQSDVHRLNRDPFFLCCNKLCTIG